MKKVAQEEEKNKKMGRVMLGLLIHYVMRLRITVFCIT